MSLDPKPSSRPDAEVQVGRPSGSSLGLLALLVPLLSFLLAFLLMLDFLPHGPGGDPLSESSVSDSVPGWTGTLELSSGRVLAARLTPLHGEARHQEFDAQKWREQLGLGPGEPFRLTLSLVGESAGADDEPEAIPGALPSAALDASAVMLVSAGGEPLRLVDGLIEGDGLPAWARLLNAGGARLRPGTDLELILWGPRPGPRTELRGWGSRGEMAGSSAEPASSIVLESIEIELDSLPRELAALPPAG